MIARLFAVDLRTLGAFRAALAALVLIDIGLRVLQLVPHYTDSGVLLRADVLSWFAGRHRWPVSLFLAGGNAGFVAILFVIYASAAAAMLVGWHARVATACVWLLTTSIHLRNPFVLYGGDTLIRMLLFWAMLLPVGARLSVDAWRRSEFSSLGERYLSIAGAGLLAQVFIVFFIAGLAKATHAEWVAGNGLLYALDHETFTAPLGEILRNHELLSRWLGWSVVAIEIGGALLLFSPVATRQLRVFSALLLTGTFVCIGATMRVGLFPLASVVALVPFLPGAWFSPSTAHGDTAASSLPRRPAVECLAAAALIYLCVWNTGLWYAADYRPPAPLSWLGETLSFQQKWGMFTDLPSTGWFEVEAVRRDGATVDLLGAGGPLPDFDEAAAAAAAKTLPVARPDRPADQFGDVHWRSFFEGMGRRRNSEGQLLYYGRYLCREWNRRAAPGGELDTIEIRYYHRPVDSRPGPKTESDYERSVLWIHDCFG